MRGKPAEDNVEETLPVAPATVLQIRSRGKGKGRETIHCPSESWWYWDRRGSREVVTCLDSGQTVKVDRVGIANGLDVGCEGKRGVPPGHLAQETAKRKFIVSHLLIKGELHV